MGCFSVGYSGKMVQEQTGFRIPEARIINAPIASTKKKNAVG